MSQELVRKTCESQWLQVEEKNKRLKGFLECTESDFSSGGRKRNKRASRCRTIASVWRVLPQPGQPQGTSHLVPGLSQHSPTEPESGHLGCGHKGPCLLGHLFRDKERETHFPRNRASGSKLSLKTAVRYTGAAVTSPQNYQPHQDPPRPITCACTHTHTLTPMFPRLPGDRRATPGKAHWTTAPVPGHGHVHGLPGCDSGMTTSTHRMHRMLQAEGSSSIPQAALPPLPWDPLQTAVSPPRVLCVSHVDREVMGVQPQPSPSELNRDLNPGPQGQSWPGLPCNKQVLHPRGAKGSGTRKSREQRAGLHCPAARPAGLMLRRVPGWTLVSSFVCVPSSLDFKTREGQKGGSNATFLPFFLIHSDQEAQKSVGKPLLRRFLTRFLNSSGLEFLPHSR